MPARASRWATSTRSRRATPGLVAILTAKDVPGENAFGIFPGMKDQPVLAPGVVRFRGEAVLALVGTRAAVEGISDAELPIEWELEAPISGIEAALAPGAPAIHAGVADNVLARGNLEVRRRGKRGTPRAAATAEGRFETAFVEHAYIEPEAGYAVPIGDGPDRIEVTACTQAPYMDLEETARVLGVDQSRVRIRPTACGGGFGGKLDVSVQPLLAVAAWVTRRPVRIVYTRTELMASTTKRHPARIWAKSSADAQGRLTAFEMQADFNTGAYASWGPTVANRVPVHGMGPYKVPNASLRTRAVYTNDTPAGAFRGFGVPQAAIAHETLMDDLAERLGLDRWAIRRINALDHGDVTPSGQVLEHSAGLPKCLDALEGRLGRGAGARRAPQRERAAAPARRRHRLHVVRLRQHRPAEPLGHAHHASARRGAHLLQRRRRHRPGLVHGAAADRGRCPGPAAARLPHGGRRHRPDRRRRQDLGLAPDVRVRQRRAPGGRGPAPENPGARQCRPGREADAGGRAALHQPTARPRARSISRPSGMS